MNQMKLRGIKVSGIKIKAGKAVTVQRRLDVSAQIRQRKSKKVKLTRRIKGIQKP